MSVQVELDRIKLATYCRSRGIRRLMLFGSVLRDDFSEESDIDVLVEFLPNRTPGLAFFTIQDELSELLGRKVDLNTADDLSRYTREEIVRGAHVVYDGA